MTGVLAMWLLMCLPMFFWGGCPCCGELPPYGCAACPDGIAECWEFAIAGVTDDECNCETIDGTYLLTRQELLPCSASSSLSHAEWWSPFVFECSPSDDFRWSLGQSSVDGIWRLTFFFAAGAFLVQYELDAAEFDCDDSNTFALTLVNDACQGWPATVTLDPITCP